MAAARASARAALWREAWPLVPILMLAAGLRLAWPGLSPFSYDEARLATLALEWAQGGPPPLAGMISSIGISNPPLSVYLFAIPAWFSPDPLWMVAFVGLLNVVAVAGCYGLAHRMFGRPAAISSALLFAASPWALLYGRWLWAQSLLPPFVLLAVASGYLALVEGRARWLVALPVAVALTVQLHLSGLAMALWMGLALLLFRERVRPRPLLAGLLLAALSWLPYLLHLQQRGTAERAALLGRVGGAARLDAEALRTMWLVTTGSQIHSLAGPEQFRAFVASQPPYEPLFALLGLLVVAAVAWLGWGAARGAGATRGGARLLLLWLAAPLLLFTFHSVDLPTHYFIVLFPAPFMAVGALVAAAQRWRPPVGAALAALVALVALGQALVFVALLGFVGGRATPGGLGLPLRYWREAAARVRSVPACQVSILGEGTWPEYHAQPAIWTLLLHDDPRLRFLEASVEERLPPYDDGRTLVVVPPPPAGAPVAASLPAAGSDLPSLPLRPGEGEIAFLYRDGGLPGARSMPLAPVRFANGMQLLGYALSGEPVAGQTLRLFLHWQLVERPDPAGEIYAYNHLLTADGARVAQADGYLCPMDGWRAGQQVWVWYDIALPADAPPGPFHLRTGLYTFPEIANLAVLGPDGAPAGDGVRLELPQ